MSGKTMTELSRAAANLYLFVLGAAGLGGQTAWARIASAGVGGTAASSAIVLAAAMAGLALGAFLSSRWAKAERVRFALVLSTSLCAAFLAAVPSALGAVASAFAGSLVSRQVAAGVILVLAHLPFGAAYPLVLAWRGAADRGLATGGGELYGAFAAGAAAGAFVMGEGLAPVMGLDTASLLLGLPVFASLALLRGAAATPDASTTAQDAAPVDESEPVSRVLLYVAALALGALGLATEAVWMRIYGFHWQASTRTYALVAGAYVAGLAAGSLWATRLPARALGSRWGLVVAVWCACVMVLATTHAGVALTGLNQVYERVLSALLLAGAPATCFGAAYVLLLGRFERSGAGAREVALLWGLNNLGSALGPLALWWALSSGFAPVFVLVAIGAGYAALALSSVRFRAAQVLAALALFAGAAVGGQYWASKSESESVLPAALRADAPDFGAYVLPYERQDAEATVSVTRQTDSGIETLWVNGQIQGDSSLLGMALQRRLGTLPVELLGRGPRRVLVIGLGTGVTANALASAGTEQAEIVEVAELSAGVIEAARTELDEINGGLARRSNVRLRHADGRTVLLDAPAPYDLIVADMVFPNVPGAGNLFSREFYALARHRIGDDGVFVHWLPCFQLARADVASTAAAFLEAFPDGSAWIGFLGPRKLVLGLAGGKIAAAIPKESGAYLALDASGLRALVGDAQALRDADPRLEYRSLPIEDDRYGTENFAALMPLLRKVPAPAWFAGGKSDGDWALTREAWAAFGDARVAAAEADAAVMGTPAKGEALVREARGYSKALSACPSVEDAKLLLDEMILRERLNDALEARAAGKATAERYALLQAAADPLRIEGTMRLAEVLAEPGNFKEAVIVLEQAARKRPRSADVQMKIAMAAYNLRDLKRARAAFEKAKALRPDRPPLYADYEAKLDLKAPSTSPAP
ncbi:MAG: hypothetical protein L6R28_23075 [Planctomycetes bacterium]|nr:hypothetical protein [Planctomycetota bacterium]